MHLRTLLTQAFAASLVLLRVSADEMTSDENAAVPEMPPEDPIVKVTSRWPENNPFGNIVNGQQNYIDILVENKTPVDIVVNDISGTLSNAKTGTLIRNIAPQKLGVSIEAGSGLRLPYAFHSELKPGEARFKVFVNVEKESVPEQIVAHDGLVTIAEPPFSLFDWKLLSTWGMVLALLAGGTYFTYLSFFPAPKAKTKSKAPVAEKVDTPVTPGSGVYSEEWIPAHHMKKTKSKGSGAVSSGDESDRRKKR